MWIPVWSLVCWVVGLFVDNVDKYSVVLGTPITITLYLISKHQQAFYRLKTKEEKGLLGEYVEEHRFALIAGTLTTWAIFLFIWWFLWGC